MEGRALWRAGAERGFERGKALFEPTLEALLSREIRLYPVDLATDYSETFPLAGIMSRLAAATHGRHRAALSGQGVFPRPVQPRLPIWLGVGGTPTSFVRAGVLGLPLMVAIIGGEPRRFRPLVDLYREAGRRAGYSPEQLPVGVHAVGGDRRGRRPRRRGRGPHASPPARTM